MFRSMVSYIRLPCGSSSDGPCERLLWLPEPLLLGTLEGAGVGHSPRVCPIAPHLPHFLCMEPSPRDGRRSFLLGLLARFLVINGGWHGGRGTCGDTHESGGPAGLITSRYVAR